MGTLHAPAKHALHRGGAKPTCAKRKEASRASRLTFRAKPPGGAPRTKQQKRRETLRLCKLSARPTKTQTPRLTSSDSQTAEVQTIRARSRHHHGARCGGHSRKSAKKRPTPTPRPASAPTLRADHEAGHQDRTTHPAPRETHHPQELRGPSHAIRTAQTHKNPDKNA